MSSFEPMSNICVKYINAVSYHLRELNGLEWVLLLSSVANLAVTGGIIKGEENAKIFAGILHRVGNIGFVSM